MSTLERLLEQMRKGGESVTLVSVEEGQGVSWKCVWITHGRYLEATRPDPLGAVAATIVQGG